MLGRIRDGDGIDHRINGVGIDPARHSDLPTGDLHTKPGADKRPVTIVRRCSHDIGLELQAAISADSEHVTAGSARSGRHTVTTDRDKIDLT